MNAEVRLVSPEYHDSDGLMHVDPELLGWQDVEYGPVEGCEHVETMCTQCVESWRNDHEIRFVRDTLS